MAEKATPFLDCEWEEALLVCRCVNSRKVVMMGVVSGCGQWVWSLLVIIFVIVLSQHLIGHF